MREGCQSFYFGKFRIRIAVIPVNRPVSGTDAYRMVGDLEQTDFIMNNSFWVGVYPGMTDEKIDYMARIIKEAVAQ